MKPCEGLLLKDAQKSHFMNIVKNNVSWALLSTPTEHDVTKAMAWPTVKQRLASTFFKKGDKQGLLGVVKHAKKT